MRCEDAVSLDDDDDDFPMHSYDFPPYVCGKLEHIVIISMKKLEFDNHGWHDLSIYISLWEEGEKSSKGNQERWL